jgi:hypothetical protein
VRTKTDQFYRAIIRQTIDQDKVGFRVRIAAITPLSGQGVVDITPGKSFAFNDETQKFIEHRLDFLAVNSGFYAILKFLRWQNCKPKACGQALR